MNRFAILLTLIVCFGPAFGAAQKEHYEIARLKKEVAECRTGAIKQYEIDGIAHDHKRLMGEYPALHEEYSQLTSPQDKYGKLLTNHHARTGFLITTLAFSLNLADRLKEQQTENAALKQQLTAAQQQLVVLQNAQAQPAQGGASAAAAAGAGAGKAQSQKSVAHVAHKPYAAQANGAGAAAPGGPNFD